MCVISSGLSRAVMEHPSSQPFVQHPTLSAAGPVLRGRSSAWREDWGQARVHAAHHRAEVKAIKSSQPAWEAAEPIS